MVNTIDNLNEQNILIIGNSPESKNYFFQELIDNNFFTVRFKCNHRPYSKKKLGKFLGKKTGLYFKTRCGYLIDGIELNGMDIRNEFHLQHHCKPTRGLEAILLFLEYYKKKEIDKKIYIHGFSFDSNNITPNWKNEARKFNKPKYRKMRRKRLLQLGTYHIDKLPHNYTLEKMIITNLLDQGKLMYLTDYPTFQHN